MRLFAHRISGSLRSESMNKTESSTQKRQTRATGQLSGIELLRKLLDESFPAPPFAKTTNIWPIRFDEGLAVFEGKPSSRFYNPMGVVHGGWIMERFLIPRVN